MEVELIISSRGVGIVEVSGLLCTVLFMHDNVCSFRSYVSWEAAPPLLWLDRTKKLGYHKYKTEQIPQ